MNVTWNRTPAADRCSGRCHWALVLLVLLVLLLLLVLLVLLLLRQLSEQICRISGKDCQHCHGLLCIRVGPVSFTNLKLPDKEKVI